MMRRSLLSGLCLILTIVATAQVAEQDMLSYTASPAAVQLYWKDDKGHILGSIAALQAYVQGRQQRLVFAMNAGMYQEDQSPLGLFIDKYQEIKALNTRKGNGNFYLQPNGVLYLRRDN